MGQIENSDKDKASDAYRNRIKFISNDEMLGVAVKTLSANDDKVVKQYDLLLHDMIYSDGLLELCDVLHQANKQDKVIIHIDTPGGSISLMAHLLLAMQQCKAEITTHAHKTAASCGAIIWALGDKIKCDLDTRIMYHDAAQGAYGKLEYLRDNIDSTRSWVEELIAHSLEIQLITPEEYNTMLADRRDIYLFGSVLQEHITKANEFLSNVQKVA